MNSIDLNLWCYKCTSKEFNNPRNYINTSETNEYVKIYSDYKNYYSIDNINNVITPEKVN